MYIDAFSGVSGDMLMGAFIALGFDLDRLTEEIRRLGIEAQVRAEKTRRHSIEAVNFTVEVRESAHVHRDYAHIKRLLSDGMAPGPAKDMALFTFARLAEAEAEVHGVDVDRVHFHEVGGVDSIVDIVGVSLAFTEQGASRVVSSPVPLGRGFVDTEHGRLPVPAPATIALLSGVPVYAGDIEMELTTPTGAALLAVMADAFGTYPRMIPDGIGYGAGDREYEGAPNLLRIVAGRSLSEPFEDQVVVISAHIDDMNPQFYEPVVDRLFDAGALDVTITPTIMKKGRPATLLTVICTEEQRDEIASLVLSDTTTIGLRFHEERRIKLDRRIETIRTQFGEIRVKLAENGDGVVTHVHPEYEDIKNAAGKYGVSPNSIYRHVMAHAERTLLSGDKSE
jgi:uncharacterized protein (TIGR00299 family) protein